MIQDRQFFGAPCPLVKVELTTTKKRGQSPRHTATTVTLLTRGDEEEQGKNDIGSYCSGTVSRELAHPIQDYAKSYLFLWNIVVRLET